MKQHVKFPLEQNCNSVNQRMPGLTAISPWLNNLSHLTNEQREKEKSCQVFQSAADIQSSSSILRLKLQVKALIVSTLIRTLYFYTLPNPDKTHIFLHYMLHCDTINTWQSLCCLPKTVLLCLKAQNKEWEWKTSKSVCLYDFEQVIHNITLSDPIEGARSQAISVN